MPTHPDQQPDGSFLCRCDNTVHVNVNALHDHLKRFRISREKYYTTYHARYDKLTHQALSYKDDWEQYLSNDFASKVTMKKWCTQNPQLGLEWGKQWLKRRKEEKGLEYAPSQAELRTLQCPSAPFYEVVAAKEGGYYGVTRALGFKDRYNTAAPRFAELPKDVCVLQDSREQEPITLALTTREATVSVGDYALADPHDGGIRIERKSLSDFCGTLSSRVVKRKGGRKKTGITEDSPFQRFERELQRAKESNLYVVMMVESSITDAQRFDYLPQTQWIKASPSHIFHNLRDLLSRYPLTFQCLFVDGRLEMARVIPLVFQMGGSVRSSDLQWHYEEGRL